MSTAYAIESIDILRKRRLVCAIFAQARSNLRLHFALLAASFACCSQKANRVRLMRTILLRIFSQGKIFRKHQMAQPLIAGINLQSLLRQISQTKNSALSCLDSYAWVEGLSPKSIMLRLMQVFIIMHESIIINANV